MYDLETFIKIRAVPYASGIYKLSITLVQNNRYIIGTEYQNSNKKSDCIVFQGLDNFNEMLDYILQFKGEPKKSEK